MDYSYVFMNFLNHQNFGELVELCFEMAWGWVNDDRIVIFKWTVPLNVIMG